MREISVGVLSGVLFLAPAVSAADPEFLTVQNSAVVYAPVSFQFTTWTLLFGICIISLFLSWLMSRYDLYTAGMSVIFGFCCTLLVPFIATVSYDTGTLLYDNTTLITTVTPVVTEMGSPQLMLIMIFVDIVATYNLYNRYMSFMNRMTAERRAARASRLYSEFPKIEED
ncbi:MAG: hypothetical protein O0X93_01740 [Methanocorpusculum sp.]|nr:hypothetical protein [Methanocorpusculum sp.]MDE2521867.1 hypothetical protein [Methanocorpusculum sp.]MDE2524860.1 hypothetical protein [Methanocorpusculum sp.]